MKLTDQEAAMLAGAQGPARQFGMEQIVSVGRFFDAADCVEVGNSREPTASNCADAGAAQSHTPRTIVVRPKAERMSTSPI